jgi:hypothetical protein
LQEQEKLMNDLIANKQKLNEEINSLEAQQRVLQADLNHKTSQLNHQEFIYHDEKEKLNKLLIEKDTLIKNRLPFNERQRNSSLNIGNIKKLEVILIEAKLNII